MRGLQIAIIGAAAACGWAAQAQTVFLDDTRLQAVQRGGSTVVLVPVTNQAPSPVDAELRLAWLSPREQETSNALRMVTIAPGGSTIEVPFPLTHSSAWARLRYSLKPASASAARYLKPVSGVASLPHIAAFPFEVRATLAGQPRPGQALTVYAQALHPVTRQTVQGVQWKAVLSGNGDEEWTPRSMRTLTGGVVEFVFDFSKRAPESPDDDLVVDIEASLGDFTQDLSLDAPWRVFPSARIQTDKPLYQPGQALRVRAVLLDTRGRAWASAKVILRVESLDGERLHSAELTSSRFGVVQDEWAWPASAELGHYRVSLWTAEEGGDNTSLAEHTVRLNRYELPLFKATVQADRGFYLPGQSARVTVRAEYLFGKPVVNANVKIERDGEGNQPVAEGKAGSDGVFTASLALRTPERLFPDYSRFQDFRYIARVTDPVSGRTEQREFDVRLSREPLHIYVSQPSAGGPLPAPLYVTVSHADGQPAQARVTLRAGAQSFAVTTNRYGVGRAMIAPAAVGGEAELRAEAVDVSAPGVTGAWTERLQNFPAGSQGRLSTPRTLYRAGEAVTLTFTTASAWVAPTILVHAVADGQHLATRAMQVTQGRGTVTFPYQPEFRRTVTFVAATGRSPNESDAERTVIFPDASDLAIRATPERATYKPGETAALRFRVSAANGRGEPAALGVAIVDEAVMERARTETQRPWFACAFCSDARDTEVAGIRLTDLFHLPAERRSDADLDLVAELLSTRVFGISVNGESESLLDAPEFQRVKDQMLALEAALERHYAATLMFPRRDEDLLAAGGPAWAQINDPWTKPYRAAYSVDDQNLKIEIWSAGPDRQHGTADDFSATVLRKQFFAPTARLIRDALEAAGDYPASEAELAALLAARGLVLGAMPDPWNSPYRAEVYCYTGECRLTIISNGPDRRPATGDDVHLASFSGPHFLRASNAIRKALAAAKSPPQTEAAFGDVLTVAGIDLARDLDPWKRPYRITTAVVASYADVLRMRTERVYGQTPPPPGRVETIPVTQRQIVFKLRSAGPDGKENTYDDFDVAQFFVLLSQETGAGPVAPAPSRVAPVAQDRGMGTIAGRVMDSSGALVPATRIILRDAMGRAFETTAGADGVFEFLGVPPGEYSLDAQSPGFRQYSLKGVPVQATRVTTVEIQLEVGAVTESVVVSAEVPMLMTSSAQLSAEAVAAPLSTPRVRDYFPETLLWQPEIVTSADGTARVTVPLAGNITTWKVAAIASTLDGRFAETATSFRAFQPFFADFTPPPVLTAGDRIDLPVTVRNYTAGALATAVQFAPQSAALRIEGSASQNGTLAANESRNFVFRLHADAPSDKAALQATARAGRSAGDALRRELHVQPDGQRVTTTRADLITRAGATALDGVAIPTTAIAGATRVELRLYPNTAALLWESAAAIVREPHGCAEQITSAGYANLIAVRFARATNGGPVEAKGEKAALTHVRQAVDALKGLADANHGGVPYWRSEKPDTAVTAQALSFLLEAREAVPVDAALIEGLVAWLERTQSATGTWEPRYQTSAPHVRQLTAHVARALAQAKRAGVAVNGTVLSAAFHHLLTGAESTAEPYLLAQYALAAMDEGEEAVARTVVQQLAASAREERGALYWDLPTNTPFHGWGNAGRQEATGLAVTALSLWRNRHADAAALDPLIRRGTLFLLRNRDALGWWSSTQGTLRAMQAVAAMPSAVSGAAGAATVTLRAGEQTLRTIPLPARSTDALIVDLPALPSGPVELTTSSASPVVAQLVVTHWVPWARTRPRESGELRLAVHFNRTTAGVGEPVRCQIKAERVGFRGYGMLIAEVGLPPGAEVDRASLPYTAEVLPDRVRFYLWPSAGGEEFEFFFSARYPLAAQSAAPSILYDYYNPEALTELPPVKWRID